MKQILLTLCALVLTVGLTQAQTVTETESSMSLGAQNGFYIDIDGADEEAIEQEMKDAEKEMKNLDKDMTKLEKQNKGYHNDIEKAKQKIEEAEKNIEQNLRDQDDQKVMIAKQKEKLEEIVSRLNSVGKN